MATAPIATVPRLYDDEGRPLGRGELPFTDEQVVAVSRREGPMLLSANAGSGKTAVLAERFVRSVVEDGLAPHELLAITFTEKAAGELRARIRARLTELGATEAARDTAEAWISTIHGFCARVLRAHAVAVGLDPGFTVLDESAARGARFEAFDRALERFLSPDEGPEGALELVAAWGVDRLRDAVIAVYEELRSTGETTPRLPPATPRAALGPLLAALGPAHAALAAEAAAWPVDKPWAEKARGVLATVRSALEDGEMGAQRLAGVKLAANANALKTDAGVALRELLATLAEALIDDAALADHSLIAALLESYGTAYASAKRTRSAVDYDDLELMTRDLFDASTGISTAYSERFARIMVDEFQDTNPLQVQLLSRLDRDNIFLVGDELQSIYGFRQADIEVFRAEHERHAALGAAPELATNWRTRPSVLAGINAAFGGEHPRYVPLAAGRSDEALTGDAPRIELMLVDAAFDEADADLDADVTAGMPSTKKVSRLVEAHTIARRVGDLLAAGHSASEVAILMRAAPDMAVYERALERQGIPTLASGGRGYWLRQQVQDLTSYLGALANPLDEEALFSLLASPLVGLSSDGLATLVLGARSAARSVFESFGPLAETLGPDDRQRLARFAGWFADERQRAPRISIDQLIARVVDRTGYDLHVLSLSGGRRRLANVHKLQRLAASFEADNGRDARGFIDYATAEMEVEAREPEAPIELGNREAVRLMTIHAAKGLEFDVVVVADIGRQGKGDSSDLMVDGDEVGLRVIRPGLDTANAFAFDEIRERRRAAADAEERRIFHVAFTRARERLILSGAIALKDAWPAPSPNGPPLHWIGACLDESLLGRLAASGDASDSIERESGGWELRCSVSLTGPGTTAAPADSDDAPGPVQLQLGIEAATPPPPRRSTHFEGAPAPAVHAPPPITALSYSSLSRYTECPYRYYLQRILNLPDQDPPPELVPAPDEVLPGLDPRVRGSIAHRLLELSEPSAVGEAEVRDAAAEAEAELTDEDIADLISLAHAFGDSPLSGRLAAATRVRREYPFAFGLDEAADAPLVNGIVDVLAQEPDGGLLVVDYKTNRVGDADLQDIVDHTYGFQRTIYALAALLTGAERAEIAYCFLERPAESVISTHTQADVPDLLADLRARAAGMRNGDFPVTAQPHRDLCLTCPGRGGLCSWPQERVLQPLPAAEG